MGNSEANPSQIYQFLPLTIVILFLLHPSHQLQPSQSQTILQIQQLLGFYSANSISDFCTLQPSPSFALSCYQDSLTQLHISSFAPLLPLSSSLSLFSSISTLTTLKVLSLPFLGLQGPLPASIAALESLEILNVSSNCLTGSIPVQLSALRNLQTIILDNNSFSGRVPAWLSSLPSLAHLSFKNNSFSGSLPNSLTRLQNIRVLVLSQNRLTGALPRLCNLTNLQILDLENNYFGPHFPCLHDKLLVLSLRNNSFGFNVPSELASYGQLVKLDISLNGFVGRLPTTLFSLPSISYLDISENKFTGFLLKNITCSPALNFVNLSSNLLCGYIPDCLQSAKKSRNVTVLFANNCLSNKEQQQHPLQFCQTQALAVPIPVHGEKDGKSYARPVIASSMIGGIALVGFLFIAVRNRQKISKTCKEKRDSIKATSTRLIIEKVSAIDAAKLLTDASYISQTMKLGASLPAYRTFVLDELKEATNNFDASSLIRDDPYGQTHRGKLSDGSLVVIRSLRMRKRRSQQSFTSHIEMFSRLRHTHLASATGHCFESSPNDSTVCSIHLVFENVPNGTLRSYISEGIEGKKFNWMQRIGAAIGVAKAMQFLHSGTIPGGFRNHLKINDVLLDKDFQVKISCCILPLFAENPGTGAGGVSPPRPRTTSTGESREDEDKIDVYNIGVILLEMIVGRPMDSANDIRVARDLVEVSMGMETAAQRRIVDATVAEECTEQSLEKVMEICVRSIAEKAEDRPSLEDILWNLQFAAQVQSTETSNNRSI